MNEPKAKEVLETDKGPDSKPPISSIKGSDTAKIDYATLYTEKARARARAEQEAATPNTGGQDGPADSPEDSK